jgi:hypothetical protein
VKKGKAMKKESKAATATTEVPPQEDAFAAERQATAPRQTPPWERPANPGKRFTVLTPNRQFNGERHGVRFQEGVGFTDDAELAATFCLCGYTVEDAEAPKKKDK